MARQIDCRGLGCPRPVINTKKAMDAIDAGTVTVIVDSITSMENVKRFVKKEGYQTETEEKKDGLYIDITKQAEGEKEQAECSALPTEGNYTIFITTDVLGTGERKLGSLLIKAFLNTLWDTENKPDKIIFMNAGVKLAVEDSDVLETLYLLEKGGVKIISCGTCLAFYELNEKLQVGIASNMYDIVNSLLASPKIIKI